jgi:hypothetical protein
VGRGLSSDRNDVLKGFMKMSETLFILTLMFLSNHHVIRIENHLYHSMTGCIYAGEIYAVQHNKIIGTDFDYSCVETGVEHGKD